MTPILVACATKHGSTGEIADAIASVFRERGVDAEARPAKEVTSLDAFDGVVVGSAVYMNNWQGDAIDFPKRFERQLLALPVWHFSSGPTGGTPDSDARVVEIVAAQPRGARRRGQAGSTRPRVVTSIPIARDRVAQVSGASRLVTSTIVGGAPRHRAV